MEEKSKVDDYDGDDEEGKTSSDAEEEVARAGEFQESADAETSAGIQKRTNFQTAVALQNSGTADIEVDEKSKEETIRKLLEETLVVPRESSKGAIDHVLPREHEEALDKTYVKKSFGFGRVLDKMRSTTSAASGPFNGRKSDKPRKIAVNFRRTQSFEPDMATKRSREFDQGETKVNMFNPDQGQTSVNASDQSQVKVNASTLGQDKAKPPIHNLPSLRRPQCHSRIEFVKSDSVTDPHESAISPLGRQRKISASMSRLAVGVTHAASSLDVSRRASTGMGHQLHHGGAGGSGSTGSFKNFRLQNYDSPNSSLSPSPSPLVKQDRADPATSKRLYLLQRSGTVGTTTAQDGSRLNPLSANRSASERSGTERPKRGRRSGRPPLVRDSFYRGCRSNSFAFSMDVKSSAPLKDLPPREQRHRKVGYAIMICSSLLLSLAVLCIVISLHFSHERNKAAANGNSNVTTPPTVEPELRKENEDLLRSIVQTPSSLNVSLPAPTSSIPLSTSFPPPQPPGGAPAAPPESLRESIQPNNIISIGSLHVQKHRGTRQTTTTSAKSSLKSPAEATQPRFSQEEVKGQAIPQFKPSSNSKTEDSKEVLEDRDEVIGLEVTRFG